MHGHKQARLRFAPSPNGYLHLGHAYSALVNAKAAKRLNAELLLRIEDIDTTRCSAIFEDAIVEDLAWIGLKFEQPLRRQSEHFDDYHAAFLKLRDEGLVYPAFKSRGDIKMAIRTATQAGSVWPCDPDGAPLYPTNERALPSALATAKIADGHPYSWRLNMQLALERYGQDLHWLEEEKGETKAIKAKPELWGDVVVARKEIPTSYHLSVVVDDSLQAISHVVRGRDLYQATSVHCLLQNILGLPSPIYRHHNVILDNDGRKLSKSSNATSLRTLREQGLTPDDVIALLPEI